VALLARPVFKGLVAATLWPTVPPIIFLAVWLLVNHFHSAGDTPTDTPSLLPVMFLFLFVASFLASWMLCLFIGLPLHFMLKHSGKTAFSWYFTIASVLSVAFALPFAFFDFILPRVFMFASIVLGGPFAAFVFWRKARPDLPDPETPAPAAQIIN